MLEKKRLCLRTDFLRLKMNHGRAAQPKKRVSSRFEYAGTIVANVFAAASEGQAWLRHQGQTKLPSQLDEFKIYIYSYTLTAAFL
jgi:hypothetical protein